MNPNRRDPSIIVVEDDEGHAVLIQENLADTGLFDRVHRFRNGQEVLDYFYEGSIEPVGEPPGGYLVILDIRMPKVDGVEVLRRIKSSDELKKIPVVMFTTSEDEDAVEVCYRLGCSAYVQKPVNYEQFCHAVRRLGEFAHLLIPPRVDLHRFA